MRSYFAQLFLFVSPFLLWFALPAFIFFAGREHLAFEEILAASLNQKPLHVGLAFSNIDRPYKREMTIRKSPEILIMGTSRVSEFKGEWFKPEFTFYNASLATQYSPDLPELLKSLPKDKLPKLIILGIDPHFLNPSEEGLYKTRNEAAPLSPSARLKTFLANSTRESYRMILDGRISLRQLWENRTSSSNIGLVAISTDSGFGNDGAWDRDKNQTPVDMADITRRAEQAAESGWEYGDQVSTFGLSKIEELLVLAKEHNIQVIGFNPPYSSAMSAAIERKGGRAAEIQKAVPEESRRLFARFPNAAYFDLSVPETFGSSDAELSDAIHGGEAMYRRMLDHMTKKNAALKKFVILSGK